MPQPCALAHGNYVTTLVVLKMSADGTLATSAGGGGAALGDAGPRPGVLVYGNDNGTLVPIRVSADGTLVTS